MNKFSAVMFSACATLALASGCAVDMPTDEEVANADQALCENKDGVNAVMTGIAVAAGREMRRFLAYRDFQWNTSTGKLELSANAYPRCADRLCKNTQALLSLQNVADGQIKFPGNIAFKASSLKAALKKNWDEQAACATTSCVPQVWDLGYTNWEFGSCDVKYFFNVYEKDTTTRITDPARLQTLQNNLIFLGYPENKMLNFYIRNGQISVDPTGGLNEGGTTTSGSCTLACTKFSVSDVTGQCCSCNGVNGTFQRIPNASSYSFKCQ